MKLPEPLWILHVDTWELLDAAQADQLRAWMSYCPLAGAAVTVTVT